MTIRDPQRRSAVAARAREFAETIVSAHVSTAPVALDDLPEDAVLALLARRAPVPEAPGSLSIFRVWRIVPGVLAVLRWIPKGRAALEYWERDEAGVLHLLQECAYSALETRYGYVLAERAVREIVASEQDFEPEQPT